MHSRILKAVIIHVFLIALIFPQTLPDPDLVLQEEVTPDYIAYLMAREVEWITQIAIPSDDAATMKAYMGLAILAFAWSHVDGDTLVTELDPLFENVGENLGDAIDQFGEYIVPILSAADMDTFFTRLTGFFNSGDYIAFRDSTTKYMENLDANFSDIGDAVENWLDDLEANFADEKFSDYLDAVRMGTADFEFGLQVIGYGYDDSLFVFDRTFFNRLDSLDAIGDAMGESFDSAAEWLDSVMVVEGGDVMPGIAYLREGLDQMYTAVDTLQLILTSDPFTPFDIGVAGLDSLQEAIVELDTLLGGKEYEIGPAAEGKTIKPLAIIQNMPGDGLWTIYQDFYRQSDPAGYTFGGIFPAGLPLEGLEFLAADAILNVDDDEDALYDRLQVLEAGWTANIVLDPDDPDAHFGLALVLAYEMVRDHAEVYEDIFRLVDAGRIDSVAFRYGWEDVDLTDELSEVIDHMDYYVSATDMWTNFIILIKNAPDGLGPYEIGADTQFDIVQIYVTDAAMARLFMGMAAGALDLVVEGVSSFYDGLSDIFVTDLDPTVLDFSEVDSDTALVLLLEASNPDFLSLTPYGVEQFQQAGEDLEQAFEQLSRFFDHMVDLAYAIAPYDEDFGIDGQLFIDDMESASESCWELYEDFAYPDSTMMIDSERVNFSAWFDHPPASFLVMWKNLIFGTDSTLGGLFPDRYVLGVSPGAPTVIPKRFALYPNYPNPFNPTTQIVFDLAQQGPVALCIYDIRGNEVARLVDAVLDPGRQVVTWNARGISSGIYFIRLVQNDQYLTGKMILIR